MLNSNGFDRWADEYDLTVAQSEEDNSYPFAGYQGVLHAIHASIRSGNGKRVLDLGIGTGTLAKKLYDDGYTIFGVDFSAQMLSLAREKMPGAQLLQQDFSQGIPACWKDETFDHIVCTYAIHHLRDAEKISLLHTLWTHLAPHGCLYIGDVAFASQADLEVCRAQAGDEWDEEEFYPVWENLKREFPSLQFRKISFCAGVLTLEKG